MKNLRKLTLLCGLLTAVSLSACAMPTTTTTWSQGEVKISGQPVASASINKALAHYASEARQNGEKIQAEAKSMQERSWSYEHNYTQKATYSGEQYISFLTEEYTYEGGPHGYTETRGLVFATKTGEKVTLEQYLGRSRAELQTLLGDVVRNDLDARNVAYFEDELPAALATDDPYNYYIDQAGHAMLLFNQYEIAPYSSGLISIDVSSLRK